MRFDAGDDATRAPLSKTRRSHDAGTPSKFGVIELFAGAGGLAEGFRLAGSFDVIALSDIDPSAHATYIHNYPDAIYLREDVRDLKADTLREKAGGRPVRGVLGGPPCQGFSLAGRKDREDPRNRFITEYARLVRELRPDFLLMENVPQMLFHPQFQQLLELLGRDYSVRYAILNAARYGTPQTRHRAFVLAYGRDLGIEPTFPAPTHGFRDRPAYNYYAKRLEDPSSLEARPRHVLGADPVITRILALPTEAQQATFADALVPELPLVTVRDAISDLAPLAPASMAEQYPGSVGGAYQQALRSTAGRLPNHQARAHDSRLRNLIARIPAGGDLADAPRDLWPKSHYSQAYGRLHWEGLARTVTTCFCNAGSGRFLHPADPRTLTVREAARLQGFCDDYEFVGTQAEQMRLVGNAVPVPLAHALGSHIAATLRGVMGKGGGPDGESSNGDQTG